MKTMYSTTYLAVVLSLFALLISCKNEDAEPAKPAEEEKMLTVKVYRYYNSGAKDSIAGAKVSIYSFNNAQSERQNDLPLATAIADSRGYAQISVKSILGTSTSRNYIVVAEKDYLNNLSAFSSTSPYIIDNITKPAPVEVNVSKSLIPYLLKYPKWSIAGASIGTVSGCSLDNFITFEKFYGDLTLKMIANEGATSCDGAVETYATFSVNNTRVEGDTVEINGTKKVYEMVGRVQTFDLRTGAYGYATATDLSLYIQGDTLSVRTQINGSYFTVYYKKD